MATGGYSGFFGKEMLEQLRGHDVTVKREMVGKLAEAYKHNFFSRQEQQLADSILRVLVKDSDEEVRQKLADTLKDSMILPHDIVMAMAQDVADAVACPVLRDSYLLSEEDLKQLIEDQIHSPRLEAIARREALSAKVSSALLYKKLPQVAAILFENNTAQLDEKVLVEMIEETSPSEELIELLDQRRDLTEMTQQRLKKIAVEAGFSKFSQSIEEELTQEELVEAARLYSLLGMTLEQVRTEGMPQLVHRLGQEGRLSISLLIRCLCVGELSLTETALAQLAGIPVSNARILLRDRGGKGIEALFKASKLPTEYNSIFASLVKVLLNDATLKTLHPRLLQRHLLIAIAEDPNEEAVEFASAIIRRAMHDMEEAEANLLHTEPLADPRDIEL